MRNSKFLLFLIALPPLLYLGLTQNKNSGLKENGLNTPTLMMISMACFAAIGSAMYATGPELSAERVNGWIRQVWVTPLSLRSWTGAKLVQAAMLVVPGTVVVELVAAYARNVHITPAHGVAIVVVMVLGSIPFAFFGHIIGQLLNDRAATVGQLFVLMVLSFLGGVFTPMSLLPKAIQTIGKFAPAYHLVQLNEELIKNQSLQLVHVLVLAAWAVGVGVVTMTLWRRDGAVG